MRLFLYVLDRCVDISARVVLETLVSERDFLEVNGGVLDERVDWLGYRLWIPLGPDGVESFFRSTRSSFAENTVSDILEAEAAAAETKPRTKRRKVADPPRPLPQYLRRVTSPHDLLMLVRLYAIGRGIADVAAPSGQSAEPHSHTADATRALLDCLDGRRYFAALDRDHHASRVDLYTLQRHVDSYTRATDSECAQTGSGPRFRVGGSSGGGRLFEPLAALAPLVRGLMCGTAGGSAGFIQHSSHELVAGYLLPHLEPSDSEIRRRLERVFSATGRHVSLDGMTRSQLLIHAGVELTAADASLDDSDDHSGFSDSPWETSLFAAAMSETYPAVTSLHAKNSRVLEHYSAIEDVEGYHGAMACVARSLGAVLSAPHVKGETFVSLALHSRLDGSIAGPRGAVVVASKYVLRFHARSYFIFVYSLHVTCLR